MSTDSSPIFDAALALPATLRAQLADELILSLDPPQQLADDAWEAELRRRIAEVESGEAETISSQEAMAELRARLKRRKAQ